MVRIVEGHIIPDIRLQKPFRLVVGGPSGSGKTSFVQQLVDKDFFESSFDKIIFNYPDYLEEVPTEFISTVEYTQGLVDQEYLHNLGENVLLIIDDMGSECGNSLDIEKLFSVYARKRNISVILITQNIYQQSKYFRNIRLNATGFVLFKFYAGTDINKRLLRDLGLSTLIPNKLLSKIYSTKYQYIMLDLHPNRHSEFSIAKGNIFEKNIFIFNRMEYIAVSKADFLKYFSVIETKDDTIKAVKNETKIKIDQSKYRKPKSRKRKYDTESSSDYSESE